MLKRGENNMNKQLIDIYLDWVNNYLTVKRFAQDYGLTEGEALTLLGVIKMAYDRYCETTGKDK